jgi:universal stress protein E
LYINVVGQSRAEPMSKTQPTFRKILVGVDLHADGRFVSRELSPVTANAISLAVELAKSNHAELVFIYVLPPEAVQLSHDGQMLMSEGDEYKSVYEDACEVLADIANEAKRQGIRTNSKVVFGKSWVENIREVLRNAYDLVIVGTRKRGPFRSRLFGSTGLKLLRKCPCPVWVAKPGEVGQRSLPILVAHDLTSVGESALKLGCAMARHFKCPIHVLHSIETEFLSTDEREERLKLVVDSMIRGHLASLNAEDLDATIQVDFGNPDEAILDYIDAHKVQLTVMGTVARAGIAGFFTGNTAEKLLPYLPCSVLAVKPADFTSPVLLELDEYEDELA